MERSTLCSLHFAKDCYEQEVQLKIILGPSGKKPILKPDSLPTLFPSARDIRINGMVLGIHLQ